MNSLPPLPPLSPASPNGRTSSPPLPQTKGVQITTSPTNKSIRIQYLRRVITCPCCRVSYDDGDLLYRVSLGSWVLIHRDRCDAGETRCINPMTSKILEFRDPMEWSMFIEPILKLNFLHPDEALENDKISDAEIDEIGADLQHAVSYMEYRDRIHHSFLSKLSK